MNEKPLHIRQLWEVLRILNMHYGTGDIIAVNRAVGKFTVQRQFGKHIYNFREEGRTIHFRGHQKTVP